MNEQVNPIINIAYKVFGNTISSLQYKDYVLTLLFLKLMNEYYQLCGTHPELKQKKRVLITERSSFDYLMKVSSTSSLGDILNDALAELEEVNSHDWKDESISRYIDFNSPSLGESSERNARLHELVQFFGHTVFIPDLKDISTCGELYHQTLQAFTADSIRKSKDILIPKEVVKLMTELIYIKNNSTICDPASGSGALLMQLSQNLKNTQCVLYGQEANNSQFILTKMGLILSGFQNITLCWGDVLNNPKLLTSERELQKFDVIMSIPPFVTDKWRVENALYDSFHRFQYGIPPKGQASWAYISHMLTSLNRDGQIVVTVPSGTLFRGLESKIRKEIIKNNLLEAVIALPENIFYGTNISTAILVFRKERYTNHVVFVDARKAYTPTKGINKLNWTDIASICPVERYLNKPLSEIHHMTDNCRYIVVNTNCIQENNCNLSITNYIKDKKPRKSVDVKALTQELWQKEQELKEIEYQLQQKQEQLIRLTKSLSYES